ISDVRTTTVGGVLSEMKREEGFTSHLEQVNAPQVLYGSISDLERSIERYEAEFKTTDKNGRRKSSARMRASYWLELFLWIELMKRSGMNIRQNQLNI
ncbi:hypothetical protein ACOMFI_21825, partial [Enterobacter cloacae complex sp. YD70/O97D2]